MFGALELDFIAVIRKHLIDTLAKPGYFMQVSDVSENKK